MIISIFSPVRIFFRLFFPVFFLVFSRLCFAQDYCDYTAGPGSQKYFLQAKEMIDSARGNPIPLLNKAIQADTCFTNAYYQLALVYYEKAIIAQHDIQLNSYQNYYFNKAEDCFIHAYQLCPNFENNSIPYYLGELYFFQNQFHQALEYLNLFLNSQNQLQPGYSFARRYFEQCHQYIQWMEDKTKYNAFPINKVNTSGDERYVQVTPDGLALTFLRKHQRIKVNSIYNELADELFVAFLSEVDTNKQRIYQTRASYDFKLPPELTIQSLFFSNNSQNLIISLCKTQALNGISFKDCDICQAIQYGEEWSDFKTIEGLNLTDSWDAQASLTQDGKKIYFASNRPGGFGGTDLYCSELGDSGRWNTPINLGDEINTINNEQWPFIAPDDCTLYFTSNGHFGMGGSDVFITRLQASGTFQKPINLGNPFNSVDDEIGVSTDRLGNSLYFASNRPGDQGGWDLYQAPLPIQFRPSQSTIICGQVTFDKNKFLENAKVIIRYLDKNLPDLQTTTNAEGYFSLIDKPAKQNFLLFIEKEGYFFNCRYFETPDTAVLIYENIKVIPLLTGQSVDLNDVCFSPAGDQLNLSGQLIIQNLITYLKLNPQIKIKVWVRQQSQNYTSMKEAQLRVQTVTSFLNRGGITESRYDYSVKYLTNTSITKTEKKLPEFVVEIEIMKGDK